MNRLYSAIDAREIVRIGAAAGHAVGREGIALGYNAAYDTVKVGFVAAGEYTGEFTKVSRAAVEFA
jgi:hypothetical protein